MKYFLLVVILIVVFYLMIQGIRCIIAVQEGKKRLETYKSKNIELSYGYMSYVDSGTATEQEYNDYNGSTLQAERTISKEFAVSNKNFDKAFLFRCIRDLLLENNITIYMFTEDDIRY